MSQYTQYLHECRRHKCKYSQSEDWYSAVSNENDNYKEEEKIWNEEKTKNLAERRVKQKEQMKKK